MLEWMEETSWFWIKCDFFAINIECTKETGINTIRLKKTCTHKLQGEKSAYLNKTKKKKIFVNKTLFFKPNLTSIILPDLYTIKHFIYI